LTRPETQRVVATGIGMVTPVGNDTPTSWSSIIAGKSGIGPITQFDSSCYKVHFAAEVKNFDPMQHLDRQTARRMDRFLHFAAVAAQEALADARINVEEIDLKRIGVLVGSGIGGVHTILENQTLLQEKGPRRVSPFAVPGLMLNSASAHISIVTGARGPNIAIATACATGSHALGEAAEMIRRGRADIMIAGGTEAAIIPMALAAFENMGALSTRNDNPQAASRPFDAGRDGFIMAEGAGVIILERLDVARRRGAFIYGELIGYGNNADAHHITAPSEDGIGSADCMALALDDAGLPPTAIDYINAHGTSTPLNDASETKAVKMVFGEHAYRMPISSTKSMTGHTMGAGGAIEAGFCLLTMRDGILPPTINYETPDPACDLDYVPNQARRAHVDIVMSNSFGFGGHNGTVIFRRLE
jgi:3-oxoacyl-[acyl-carrier-protein] synthase II